MREKADAVLRANKAYMSDSFSTIRNDLGVKLFIATVTIQSFLISGNTSRYTLRNLASRSS